MTRLTWTGSRALADFQQFNTDSLSLLYKLGVLNMEKLSYRGEPTPESRE